MKSLMTPFGIPFRSLSLVLVIGLAGVVGCQHGNYSYTGVEPTARTFRDNANPGDYYVGVDLNFAVVDDEPHLHPLSGSRGEPGCATPVPAMSRIVAP